MHWCDTVVSQMLLTFDVLVRLARPQVQPIVDDVKNRGDESIIELTERFDKVKLEPDGVWCALSVRQKDFSTFLSSHFLQRAC